MDKVISLDSFRRLIIDPLKTLIDRKAETWDDLRNKPNVLLYDAQILTDVQKKQACANIGIPHDTLATENYVSEQINSLGNIATEDYVSEQIDSLGDIATEGYVNEQINSLGKLAAKDQVLKTDLSFDVQNSINKANTALQDSDIADWAKESSKPEYTASEVGAADVDHTQSASTIYEGMFSGQVVANMWTQSPETSLLRNSKLVATDTTPNNNGEIYWTYV